VEQVTLHESWQSERGFTLIEVMVTITILIILAAIAVSVWWNVVESRRVDSATNQVVSDLRLAHTRATTRLDNHQVQLTVDTNTYQVATPSEVETRTLLGLEDADVDSPVIDTTLTIVFEPEGSASATPAPLPGSPIAFGVRSPDGSPCHRIEINTVTSRVEVFGNAC
jgi:prepilin-type N-terminal cleavage/methylation domain-containing protein